jgi:uncharacterized protein (DUF885 family)
VIVELKHLEKKNIVQTHARNRRRFHVPGFYVPVPDIKNTISMEMKILLTEAIPGHHFQISHNSRMLYYLRKYNWFGAYGEGWALYTESLGEE